MKEHFTTTVNVSGKGASSDKAFADALSRVQPQLLQSSAKVLLRIEPLDVQVLSAQLQVRTEKFLFFFLPRERRHYRVELAVEVSVTAIDTARVNFTRLG
ncbi:DUF4312 family protein [Erwinia sp. E602]|uniref:DUF4312 family protein n=1 Tax=Erwinia sp. E602 TaxID=2675378 RepID=UPI001BA521F4|nr:DUF4312 family protein [Erwinia sp. E602]QUG77990.1 DUF4312 family protein [Erwinia sp. E602]